ncbi:MAG: type II 3-dehydroquinate dehydratase [bacterium]|nr:type II 3-dehydroquinate dehydratase [bacterium]MDT8396245.1 type II 3-dehydroquinate dehydratase [bacterium]
MTRILVIHGPNLNLLGSRETDHYGVMTLEEIDSGLVDFGRGHGVHVETFQSNHEGEIVERIQRAPGAGFRALVINPAAFTHTSVAIRDALLAAGLPFFEIHISNIHAREEFRSRSLVSDVASGIVMGFGPVGYRLALLGALDLLAADRPGSEEELS